MMVAGISSPVEELRKKKSAEDQGLARAVISAITGCAESAWGSSVAGSGGAGGTSICGMGSLPAGSNVLERSTQRTPRNAAAPRTTAPAASSSRGLRRRVPPLGEPIPGICGISALNRAGDGFSGMVGPVRPEGRAPHWQTFVRKPPDQRHPRIVLARHANEQLAERPRRFGDWA